MIFENSMDIFLLSYYLFLYISVPIHELGHLVMGLLTGYRFIYLRVFNLFFLVENKKIIVKRAKLRQRLLSGACLMYPSADEAKFKFVLYDAGGAIFDFIFALILGVFAIIFFNYKIPFLILLGGAASCIYSGVYNLIPESDTCACDGLKLWHGLHSPQTKHAHFVLLRVGEDLANGVRYSDFEASTFDIGETGQDWNFFVAYMKLQQAQRLYDLEDYDGYFITLNSIDVRKVNKLYEPQIQLEYLYYYTVHQMDFEKARQVYQLPRISRLLKKSPEGYARILAAYEFFVNLNKEKGFEYLEKAKKNIQSGWNRGERIMEADYIARLEKRLAEFDYWE